MSLKWKTTTIFFIVSLILIPVTVEYIILTNNLWLPISLIVLIISLVGYFIGSRIGRKIDDLIVGLSKAGGGNYNQSIQTTGNDELSQLTISYNRMLDNLLSGSQEIKEQLHNYKTILENAAEGIVSINNRGVIQEYNQSAEAIFGYGADEIIGKNITVLIPQRVEQDVGTYNEQSFTTNDEELIQAREVIGIHKNEQKVPLELSVSESTINNSQIYTGIIRDITAQKQSQLKQKKLEMQLRKLQRQNSLEGLSGGIAHDFNNILGPILGYADMAIAEVDEDTRLHKHISSILKGAHRARELVAKIMSFSRQAEETQEHLHITKVIDDSLELIKSSLPAEHKVRTFINATDDLVAAECIQLTQVLMVLVTNASQSMATIKGTITIRLENITVDEELAAKSAVLHVADYICLSVQDTGKGMDSVTQSKVFEPFFSTSSDESGSGLGLSVASGIISSFDGEILVDSEVDIGSTFYVYLPLITSQKIKPIKNIVPTEKPISKKGELVLYIDDDEDIAELGKEMLENLGYEVAISIDSEDALQMFRSDPEDFDLVITDQSMPVLTGTQLARELRRIRSDIPIILVTGFSAAFLDLELADSGINHCISKPLVVDELGQVILDTLAEVQKNK